MTVPSPDVMDRVGKALAITLKAGDLIALSGPLGAGKSHLARAAIRSLLGDANAEVPSPTFTLLNVYEAAETEIWHADLYRLGDASELAEIGLDDASHAVVLVEWPDRWSDLPQRRLDVEINPENEGRRVMVRAIGGDWERVMTALSASISGAA